MIRGWELVERRGRGHRSDQVVGGSGAGLQTVISLEEILAFRSILRARMLNSRGYSIIFSRDSVCLKKGYVYSN